MKSCTTKQASFFRRLLYTIYHYSRYALDITILNVFRGFDFDFCQSYLNTRLTLFATNAHLTVLGIEVTAYVTILNIIIRRPPVVECFSHGARSAANQAFKAGVSR